MVAGRVDIQSAKTQAQASKIKNPYTEIHRRKCARNYPKSLQRLMRGVYIEPSEFTVAHWLDKWLDTYVKGKVKPLTFYSYSTHCENHIKRALGAIKLSALDTLHIQNFYNDLEKSKDEGGKYGLSAKTIKNIHGVLHKSLDKAVELKFIKFNPSKICELPKYIKKEIKPLEETEISAFLKAMAGHKFEIVFLVTLFTGMRQGEVLGLSIDCVDFAKGIITVNKQLIKDKNTGKYYLHTVKNDKVRIIAPDPFIMGALHKQKAAQDKMQLSAGQAWSNTDNLIFTNELGEHLKHVTVYKNFKKIVTGLGLDDTRFHDLRHSYAVAALQAGDDVKTVQENLGHHSAVFTLDIYGHVTDKMKKDSAARMEKFIQVVNS